MAHKPNHDQRTNESDFEWVKLDDPKDGSKPHLRVLTLTLTIMIVVGMVVSFSLYATPATAQTSFTADDVQPLSSNNGNLNSLTVAPAGTVTYNGLEQEPSDVFVTVEVKLADESSWEQVSSTTLTASGLEGEVAYSFSAIDLLRQSSFNKADFKAIEGDKTQTAVEVRVRAVLFDAKGNGNDVTAVGHDTFTVTITNEDAGAGVGGQANPNAS